MNKRKRQSKAAWEASAASRARLPPTLEMLQATDEFCVSKDEQLRLEQELRTVRKISAGVAAENATLSLQRKKRSNMTAKLMKMTAEFNLSKRGAGRQNE